LPLIYTPLLERNTDGIIIPAAASVILLDDKKTYEVELAENIFFSNKKELTSDDVIFTIEKIQDPAIKSPYYSN
jgi:peptide/nickel transport system substrate-binding protein